MKKVLLIILSILLFVSFGLIGWYAYIYFYAPEKIVSQTFKVGDQTILKEDGSTDTKTFIELNLYDNVFEIKFNYMLDEAKTAFYSQGLQYVLKDGKTDFNLNGSYTKILTDTKLDSNGYDNPYFSYGSAEHYLFTVWERTDTLNKILGDKSFDNAEVYNYMSGDDYETPLISTNPIDRDTFFKIQLGDDLYGMEFRGTDIELNRDSEFYLGEYNYQYDTEFYVVAGKLLYLQEYYYKASDVDYLATLLFNSVCSSVKAGTSQILTFEFGDLFNYYEYDESSGQYSDAKVSTDKASKISADIKSYYSIKVNRYDGDMISSSQSLFNCYKGSSNYNVDLSLDDYFIGRSLVSVDVDKFDFIESETSGAYYLSLSEDFKDFYKNYAHLVQLDILIDLDYLESMGIEFLGVIKSSLDGFKIYNAETIQTIGSNQIKGGVPYV